MRIYDVDFFYYYFYFIFFIKNLKNKLLIKHFLYQLNIMDPLWLAMSKLRRGKLEDCIQICDKALSTNPNDQVI